MFSDVLVHDEIAGTRIQSAGIRYGVRDGFATDTVQVGRRGSVAEYDVSTIRASDGNVGSAITRNGSSVRVRNRHGATVVYGYLHAENSGIGNRERKSRLRPA